MTGRAKQLLMLVAILLCIAPVGDAFAYWVRGENTGDAGIRHGGLTENAASECGEANNCPDRDASKPHHSSGKADTVYPTPSDPGFDLGAFCSLLGSWNRACLMMIDCIAASRDTGDPDVSGGNSRGCPITDCEEAIASGGKGKSAKDYSTKYDARCNRPPNCAVGDTTCDPCPDGYYVNIATGMDARCEKTVFNRDPCPIDPDTGQRTFPSDTDPKYVIAAACAELCTLDPTFGLCATMQCIMTPGPKCCAIMPVAECCDLFDLAEKVIECIEKPSPECCEILADKTVNKVTKIPQSLVDTCTAIWMCTESMIYYDEHISSSSDSTVKKNFLTGLGSDGQGGRWPEYDSKGNPTGQTKVYSGLVSCCATYPSFKNVCEGVLCLIGDRKGTTQGDTALDRVCPSAECCTKFPANPYCTFCRCQEAVQKKKFSTAATQCCALITSIQETTDKLGTEIPGDVIETMQSACSTFFECAKAADAIINDNMDGNEKPCYKAKPKGCYKIGTNGERVPCKGSCTTAIEPGEAAPGTTGGWYTDARDAVNKTNKCCKAIVGTAGTAAGENAGDEGGVLEYGSMACNAAKCFANPGIACCAAVPNRMWKTLKEEVKLDCAFIFACLINPFVKIDPTSEQVFSPAIDAQSLTLNNAMGAVTECCDGSVGVLSKVAGFDDKKLTEEIPVCAGLKCLIASLQNMKDAVANQSPGQALTATFNMKCCDAIPPTINKEIGDLCPTIVACVRSTTLVCCDRVLNLLRRPPFSGMLCDDPDGSMNDFDPKSSASYGCAASFVFNIIPSCSAIAACVEEIQKLSQNIVGAGGVFTTGAMKAILNMGNECCSIADKMISQIQIYEFQAKDAEGNLQTDANGNPIMVQARFSLCELKEVLKCMMHMTPTCCATISDFLKGMGLVFTFPLPDNEKIDTNEVVKICEILIRCYQQPGPECCALFGVVDIVSPAIAKIPVLSDVIDKLKAFSVGQDGQYSVGGLERTCRNLYNCFKQPTPGCCARFPSLTRLADDLFCTKVLGEVGLGPLCTCAVQQCSQLIECGMKASAMQVEYSINTTSLEGNSFSSSPVPPMCCSALASMGSCCDRLAKEKEGTFDDFICDVVQVTGTALDILSCNPPKLPKRKVEASCYDPNSGAEGCECQKAVGGIFDRDVCITNPTMDADGNLGKETTCTKVDEAINIMPEKPLLTVPIPPSVPIGEYVNDTIDNSLLPPDVSAALDPTQSGNGGGPDGGGSSGSSNGGDTSGSTLNQCWQKSGNNISLCSFCKIVDNQMITTCDTRSNITINNIVCNSIPDPLNWQLCVDEGGSRIFSAPVSFRGKTICRPLSTDTTKSMCVDVPLSKTQEYATCWEVIPSAPNVIAGLPDQAMQLKYHLNCVVTGGVLVSYDDSTIASAMTTTDIFCNSLTAAEWNGCKAGTAAAGVTTPKATIHPSMLATRSCGARVATSGDYAAFAAAFCVDFTELPPVPVTTTEDYCWVLTPGPDDVQELSLCRDCQLVNGVMQTCTSIPGNPTVCADCTKSPGEWSECGENIGGKECFTLPDQFLGERTCMPLHVKNSATSIPNFCVNVPAIKQYASCWYLDVDTNLSPSESVKYCTECVVENGNAVRQTCDDLESVEVDDCAVRNATSGWINCEAQPADYVVSARAQDFGREVCRPKVGIENGAPSIFVDNYCVGVPSEFFVDGCMDFYQGSAARQDIKCGMTCYFDMETSTMTRCDNKSDFEDADYCIISKASGVLRWCVPPSSLGSQLCYYRINQNDQYAGRKCSNINEGFFCSNPGGYRWCYQNAEGNCSGQPLYDMCEESFPPHCECYGADCPCSELGVSGGW